MKSKYFDSLRENKPKDLSLGSSLWFVSFKKDQYGKGYYVFSFMDMNIYFSRFDSLNDFLTSNGFHK